jgi:hypothetical protein
MINKRRKALLFVTLIASGSALLAGARLSEAVGIIILGIALSWLIGGKTVSRIYSRLQNVPGVAWPFLRFTLLFAIAGCLEVLVCDLTSCNRFLSMAAMAIFGMMISPLRHISSQHWWVKAIVWFTAFVAFLFAAVLVLPLSATANQNAQLIGKLSLYGLLALMFGMYQLIKGWNLVVEGNTATEDLEPPVAKQTRSVGLYVLMVAGVLLLTLWLGLLNFSAFSDVAYDIIAVPISSRAD